MRLLLLHPWIADVAAYNFWVRPLGLYALAEWAWERGADVALVDCLSGFPAPGRFRREPVAPPEALRGFPRAFARYGISREELRARLGRAEPWDAVLVTSAMGYWYPGVQWAVEEARRRRPGAPVLLGGVYPTLWLEHARREAGADRVFPGALEAVAAELAGCLGLPREPVRPRRPWYRLGLHDGAAHAALRTARGCPYRCAYCASEKLSGPFAPRGASEVAAELAALAELGVTDAAWYDDALLVDFSHRLGPALGEADRRAPRTRALRFHTPNGLHARLVTEEAAPVLAARFATLRLALETVDPARQEGTGAKVGTPDLERAVSRLRRAGAPPESIGVYLLVGLPGQPLEEVREGIAFVRSLGVRPHLAEFSPIPGTPAWDEVRARGLLPPDPDPLLTNNTVYLRRFAGYPPEELEALLRSVRHPLP
ncbi:MAG: B12-binding domain-containing radical SAM protein [Thermodesulfobacteriota bacterium]